MHDLPFTSYNFRTNMTWSFKTIITQYIYYTARMIGLHRLLVMVVPLALIEMMVLVVVQRRLFESKEGSIYKGLTNTFHHSSPGETHWEGTHKTRVITSCAQELQGPIEYTWRQIGHLLPTGREPLRARGVRSGRL